MQKSEQERKLFVLRFLSEVIQKGSLDVLDALVSPGYAPRLPVLSGLPTLDSGRDALRERLRRAGSIPHRVHRVIADGNLVFAQINYEGAEHIAGADIFCFGDDDLIAQHWSVRQTISAEVAAGYDRYAGGGDTAALVTRVQRERQKQLIRDLYAEVWSKGNAVLVSRYYTDHYIQHNPHIESGSARIKKILETDVAAYIARNGTAYPVDVHLLGCEGDLVFAYCSIVMAGLTRNEGDRSDTVDIFRVDAAGRLAEHWDVLQMESESLPSDATLY